MSAKARTTYWHRTLDTLEAQLKRIGCGEDDIARELEGFTAVVLAEVNRRQGRTPKPDGAA